MGPVILTSEWKLEMAACCEQLRLEATWSRRAGMFAHLCKSQVREWPSPMLKADLVGDRTQNAHRICNQGGVCGFCGSSNQQLTDNRARGMVQLRPWPPCFQKNLAESRLGLPFRSQSAIFRRDSVRFLATMMVKDLNSNYITLSPLSAASVRGVAENRSQYCPCRSHAILAETVGIT